MCGIAGFLHSRTVSADEAQALAQRMGEALVHRGPDGGHAWVDAEAGIGFAHRRLAIVDVSEAGVQPMVSHCGRYVLNYNGEVYNAAALRPELETRGVRFRGHSDTEVILESFVHHGVETTLERIIGMFAFALWDRHTRTMTLVRDRLGVKPLYWSLTSKGLLFGSELKALRCAEFCPSTLDTTAVAAFLHHNFIPAPRTIYAGIHKLRPGHMLRMTAASEAPEISAYWRLEDAIATVPRFTGSEREAVDELEALLADAVRQRMVSDVPLGAFLSGGIDSSCVLALMQKQSSSPVRSFSIGFAKRAYNEAPHAKAVAAHLGARHTELTVTEAEAQAVIPRLAFNYDEPFADSSQIPTLLVSQLTRQHVTVALSGDGGDEVFAGYNRYVHAQRLWRCMALPSGVRRGAGAMMQGIPPEAWDVLGRGIGIPLLGDKVHKLADIVAAPRSELYPRLTAHWHHPAKLIQGTVGGWDEHAVPPGLGLVESMQYRDTLCYLPDDILTKVDRASMAVGLEARVPLLDHRVVGWAWGLPAEMKLRAGCGKWVLRKVLERHVPRTLTERPKMGFGVPVGTWLRGPLRPWTEELLSAAALQRHGLLHASPIRQAWDEHLSGRRNWGLKLWGILMLQAWLEAQLPLKEWTGEV